MGNLVEEFRDTLQKQFSLRTSAASFDTISVELDGKKLPLNNIAQITFKTPQLIMINLASTPTYVQPVVAALNSSGLNLNPQIEGHVIYLPVPKVSREHRETVSKNAKTALNKFKERIRAVQNGYVKEAKNSVSASEDLIHNVVTKLMQLSDKYGKDLEALLAAKQKDLLGE
ncbi:hypothetical protein RvY_12625 [Ramazzottius varieornatus]|uniref:Ribosome-recycling factor, mitochondrial n=1 Tax=Ramazzottius varieornatus TaxID=947166 RepID=A0A1D1VK71_RAMVA|nr:hypothetical protein RvY_12625 [Ramazzottius varieornatus]